jgi:folate-dependent phosphoribosylglycinamide formyltransferase PurN
MHMSNSDKKQNKKIIVFASGTKDGGGSGFENLVNASQDGRLSGQIVAVVSNHENGGVRQRADRLGIKFVHFPAKKSVDGETGTEFSPEFGTAENYRKIAGDADLVCLSGWLKLVTGLDPRKTINIHPGPLPRFGGAGMYGYHVHEAVMEAYKNGAPNAATGKKVTHSAVSMHFVTEKFDEGPLFFSQPVEILPDDTADTLAARVLEAEHKWQPLITDKVLRGEISWDGKNPETLIGAVIK